MRNYSSLLELAKNNNGYIFSKDVVKENIPKSYLKYAVEDGVIEKIAHGIYISQDCFVDDLFVFQKLNTKIIYSAFTSAYLLELTTRDSGQIYASIPRNYNAPKFKGKGVFIREDKDVYNLGITSVKSNFGNIVKCHDIHRTICDLFSDKYVGDKFVQVEALKNYLKLSNKDTVKLMKYAKVLGVDKQLREKLEVLL